MQFSAEQRFAHPLPEVVDVFIDPEKLAGFSNYTKISPEGVVGAERSGNRVVTRVRYRFIAPLSDKVTAVVDPKKLTWVEETTIDTVAGTQTSVLHPDHYQNMIKASWNGKFSAAGSGAVRHIDGDFRLKLPFPVRMLGSKVERVIVDGIVQYLAEEQREVNGALDGK